MAFPDDVFPRGDHCEICGGELGNEVVIQEFADGSFARLCSECYSGATFGQEGEAGSDPFAAAHAAETGADPFAAAHAPMEGGVPAATAGAGDELDPLEMTKELLIPVTDLISLQGEMQTALERLASSLDRFAVQVVTDSVGKTATMETRIKGLENELEKTRNRLREAESLLIVASGASAVAGDPADAGTAIVAADATANLEALDADGPPPVFTPSLSGSLPETGEDVGMALTAAAAAGAGVDDQQTEPFTPDWQATGSGLGAEVPQDPDSGGYWTTAGTYSAPTAPAAAGAAASAMTFTLEEVRWAQRYFNDSAFTSRMRDVRRSLGRPRANLSRLSGAEPRALVTIYWDIVWYQYLVDLRREGSGEKVTLFREGMELDELNEAFRDKNASIDDDGRLDASELEVQLLSDPTVLITEIPPEEQRLLEDATEEIWDQHAAPEFKWDD